MVASTGFAMPGAKVLITKSVALPKLNRSIIKMNGIDMHKSKAKRIIPIKLRVYSFKLSELDI